MYEQLYSSTNYKGFIKNMCGIAGILWPENTNSEQLRNIADRMIATLPHRGPDDHGTNVENESGLALHIAD